LIVGFIPSQEKTMSIPDRSTFESIYAGQPPWDIGRPQKAIIDVAVTERLKTSHA
jgi:hypothetical protein